MGFLTDWLTDWLKSLLIEGILGNLSGLFDTVNARVGEIAEEVGTTPAAWNAGVFSLIRQISETVILPERRSFLPHSPDFRNGNFTDCRVSPNLCGGVRAHSNAHRPQ